jgi:tetratricopeptide (TPR) repeat protein
MLHPMSSLVPTLASFLVQADRLFGEGRIVQARRAFEELVERAQERVDRVTEGIARVMLARCLLKLRDIEGAREQLLHAARLADPAHIDAHARYRAALVRLAVEEGPPELARREVHEYLTWAGEAHRPVEVLDACLLLAPLCEPEERVQWLERGIELARNLDAAQEDAGAPPPQSPREYGRVYAELAAALEHLDLPEQALEAYQRALSHHRDQGRTRDAVAVGWAVGALACRTEDWPLARTALEDCLALAAMVDHCEDLVALALADLATVYEEAGDVIEARRLLLKALSRGKEQDLPTVWPERWEQLLAHARRLDLD